MADQYGHSFANDDAGYSNLTHVIAAAAQAEILVQIAYFKALIPDVTAAVSGDKPDFGDIPAHTATKLRAEIDLLTTAIDAAPT